MVRIEPGRLEGSWQGDVAAFKGIPYGGAVDGAGRWKPASKPAAWTGVRKAVAYGPRGIQDDSLNLRITSRR